ncbi:hypothetical protein BOO25_17065 [Vibrio navarrensis]|uniref:Lcl domain-containing protein n=1 Tax=Vibrio navarrensis TaxID=29495 RepID=UPI00192F9A1F|nr:hypothetical protein [Vibrio navarrensis]
MIQLKTNHAKVLISTLLVTALIGCGGGESGGDDSGQNSGEPQVEQRATLSAIASKGGAISPEQVTVEKGESVTFTVTADEGFELSRIAGCDGQLTGNLYHVTAAKESCRVEAQFHLKRYTVSSTVTGNGEVMPPELNLAHGEQSTVSLNPHEGFSLHSATGCGGTLAGNSYTIAAMSENCVINAVFTPTVYTVTASASNGGTISPSTQTVNYAGSATFTLTPETGYQIDAVTGCNGSLNGNTYTTGAISAACSVSASFKPLTFAVTASSNAGGAISPSTQTVNDGQSATFTLTPEAGYQIDAVTGCNGSLNGNTYTTGVITAACSVSASFKLFTPPILEQPSYHIETDGSASITLNWRNIEVGSTVNLYLAEESFNDLNDIANYASLKGATRIQTTGVFEHRFTGLAADTEYFMVATTQGTHKESPLSNQVQLVTRKVAQPTGKLNDTGIDWCADGSQNNLDCPVQGYEGQDGDHGRDALARKGQLQKIGGGAAGFDFTKLDNSGNPLPESASEWGCVRDNHTGLIWEVKQPVGSGGLRDAGHTYTWYNPDNSTNGGSAGTQNGGTCQGSACDTYAFVNAVNSQGLCGARDWRLPSVNELLTIVHNGRSVPAIEQSYFPHTTQYGGNWSSTPLASDSGCAWDVYFSYGGVGYYGKSYLHQARLVRGGQY